MNIAWIIVLLFLSFLLFGTSGPVAQSPNIAVATVGAPPPLSSTVEINGNPGVVLDVASYSHDLQGWTPAEDDLQAAEDAVLAAPAGDREPEIEGYRQYVGIVENGERKIIVNSMCDEMEGWDEQYIMVMDGGSCFWNAVYNVETGELESLIVNGDA
jgi:hypothetical protein